MKWTHIDTEWATEKEYQVISGKTKKKSDAKFMFRIGGGVVSSASKMHVVILKGHDLRSSKSH